MTGRVSPPSAMLRVRGIGVAVSVSTCTFARKACSRSLSRTPKRCSSSTMISPRSLKRACACSSRCVAMTISTAPLSMPSRVGLRFLGVAEARQRFHAHRPVGKAVPEVGQMLLSQQRSWGPAPPPACRLGPRRMRRAWPPRSYRIRHRRTRSRSIGRSLRRSASTARMACAWSRVSSNGKALAKVW